MDIETENQYLLKIREAQYSCRNHIETVINTNNIETILSCVDYICSKSIIMFAPCHFLLQHVYKLERNLITDYTINKELIDFSIFDNAIDLSNLLSKEFHNIKSL